MYARWDSSGICNKPNKTKLQWCLSSLWRRIIRWNIYRNWNPQPPLALWAEILLKGTVLDYFQNKASNKLCVTTHIFQQREDCFLLSDESCYQRTFFFLASFFLKTSCVKAVFMILGASRVKTKAWATVMKINTFQAMSWRETAGGIDWKMRL